jgi:hypothetical protein
MDNANTSQTGAKSIKFPYPPTGHSGTIGLQSYLGNELASIANTC